MSEFRENFTTKDENSFIRQVFEGGITTSTLFRPASKKLYRATAKKLLSGVKLAFEFDGADERLLKELEENIYIFSGAKTYTQVKDISSLILDGKTLRPFNEFKKLAKEKLTTYNEDYLKSEYETAVGQAQTAVKWQEIEKEAKTFPYLQRKAVMDSNTSPECRMLNDIIAPVGDPFWKSRSPLTHFRCRCIITQIDKYSDVKLSSKRDKSEAIDRTDKINPLFKGNPGIDKVIFNKSHPYFDIEPKDKGLAKRNFNLPL